MFRSVQSFLFMSITSILFQNATTKQGNSYIMPNSHQTQQPAGQSKMHCPVQISQYQPLQLQVSAQPEITTLWKILKLCLLTLSQVENGGNYPDNSSKTDKKYPHCFIHQVKYFQLFQIQTIATGIIIGTLNLKIFP